MSLPYDEDAYYRDEEDECDSVECLGEATEGDRFGFAGGNGMCRE